MEMEQITSVVDAFAKKYHQLSQKKPAAIKEQKESEENYGKATDADEKEKYNNITSQKFIEIGRIDAEIVDLMAKSEKESQRKDAELKLLKEKAEKKRNMAEDGMGEMEMEGQRGRREDRNDADWDDGQRGPRKRKRNGEDYRDFEDEIPKNDIERAVAAMAQSVEKIATQVNQNAAKIENVNRKYGGIETKAWEKKHDFDKITMLSDPRSRIGLPSNLPEMAAAMLTKTTTRSLLEAEVYQRLDDEEEWLHEKYKFTQPHDPKSAVTLGENPKLSTISSMEHMAKEKKALVQKIVEIENQRKDRRTKPLEVKTFQEKKDRETGLPRILNLAEKKFHEYLTKAYDECEVDGGFFKNDDTKLKLIHTITLVLERQAINRSLAELMMNATKKLETFAALKQTLEGAAILLSKLNNITSTDLRSLYQMKGANANRENYLSQFLRRFKVQSLQ